jgi:hypothetical protein
MKTIILIMCFGIIGFSQRSSAQSLLEREPSIPMESYNGSVAQEQNIDEEETATSQVKLGKFEKPKNCPCVNTDNIKYITNADKSSADKNNNANGVKAD